MQEQVAVETLSAKKRFSFTGKCDKMWPIGGNALKKTLKKPRPRTAFGQVCSQLAQRFFTHDVGRDSAALDILNNLTEKNPLHIGFSIAYKGITGIGSLYAQARYAISRGREQDSEATLCRFFDVAADFMLEKPLGQAVSAVMPCIQELWQERRGGDDLVNTLRCYLNNNCSAVKTASDLYIHRNTVLYRVQKAEEVLGLDFHNVYDRNYYLMAIRVLELNEKRCEM